MLLEEFKQEIREWLKLNDPEAKFSELFIHQMAVRGTALDLDVFSIYDCVKSLSKNPRYSLGQTKSPTYFKRKPLKGLLHKHYFQAAFMKKNIYNELKKPRNLEKIFQNAITTSGLNFGDIISPSFINALVNGVILDMYEQRSHANKLTGEWVVYTTFNDVNYFLTLGQHGLEQIIHKNVVSCFEEFPELKNHLAAKGFSFKA